MLERLLGVAAAIGAVVAAYYVWREVPGLIRMLPQGPIRTFATDTRLLWEVLAAFFALSVLNWIWVAVVGALKGGRG